MHGAGADTHGQPEPAGGRGTAAGAGQPQPPASEARRPPPAQPGQGGLPAPKTRRAAPISTVAGMTGTGSGTVRCTAAHGRALAAAARLTVDHRDGGPGPGTVSRAMTRRTSRSERRAAAGARIGPHEFSGIWSPCVSSSLQVAGLWQRLPRP